MTPLLTGIRWLVNNGGGVAAGLEGRLQSATPTDAGKAFGRRLGMSGIFASKGDRSDVTTDTIQPRLRRVPCQPAAAALDIGTESAQQLGLRMGAIALTW